MKYVKSADEEYILNDGESINDLGKCKLQDAKEVAETSAKKHNINHLYDENSELYRS